MARKVKNPFIEKQIYYDERSSCYVQYGSNYGVGFAQPVGTKKSTKMDAIPKSIPSPDLSQYTPPYLETNG